MIDRKCHFGLHKKRSPFGGRVLRNRWEKVAFFRQTWGNPPLPPAPSTLPNPPQLHLHPPITPTTSNPAHHPIFYLSYHHRTYPLAWLSSTSTIMLFLKITPSLISMKLTTPYSLHRTQMIRNCGATIHLARHIMVQHTPTTSNTPYNAIIHISKKSHFCIQNMSLRWEETVVALQPIWCLPKTSTRILLTYENLFQQKWTY